VELEIRGLSHTYESANKPICVLVLKNISFELQTNDFVAVVGPSGCGKTTLLNLIAAFIPCQTGEILIDGQRRGSPSCECVLISQDQSLFDWKTVLENVAFGLKARGLRRQQQLQKAMHYLALVNLTDVSQQYPKQLSAGMKQRLALARALAVEPKLILMDEPFASLDWQSRLKLQDELLGICETTKQTVLLTTHDVGEAIYLADRVMVLTNKPAEIAGIVDIPIPKPRKPELRYQSSFLALEQDILRTLT
jgi:NitT/TauT family transport system ATP-binding protein